MAVTVGLLGLPLCGARRVVWPERSGADGRLKAGHDGGGGGGGGVSAQAVFAAVTPSSAAIRSRIRYFCTFPVTVIGNSSTSRMWRGTL